MGIKLKFDQKKLGRKLAWAGIRAANNGLRDTAYLARQLVPVDTSSLQTDIKFDAIFVTPSDSYSRTWKGVVRVGGGDYRGITMPKTGKQGKEVLYAIPVDLRTQFMSDALDRLPQTIISYLPAVL